MAEGENLDLDRGFGLSAEDKEVEDEAGAEVSAHRDFPLSVDKGRSGCFKQASVAIL